jgi:hypothetical protein
VTDSEVVTIVSAELTGEKAPARRVVFLLGPSSKGPATCVPDLATLAPLGVGGPRHDSYARSREA